MAVQGIKFNVPKSVVSATIIECKGRLNKISDKLNFWVGTVREFIRADPELSALLDEMRNKRDEDLLEGAEDVLQYAIDVKADDLTNALKSAFFVLNNKGRGRGYLPPALQNQQEVKVMSVEDLIIAAKSGELTQPSK